MQRFVMSRCLMMDALIRVYNSMVDRLREERLKLEEQAVLLDQIFRVSPSGMITLDFDGRVRELPGHALD